VQTSHAMNDSETEIEIPGFTIEDAHRVIWNAREQKRSKPKNDSGPSTISGPIMAARKYNPDIGIFG
jgi:hypothetical protein